MTARARPDVLDREPKGASNINTRTHTITFFKDKFATELSVWELTLPQLAHGMGGRIRRNKLQLLWLKLAVFGNKRTDKHCLRHNANVVEISGIEGEHDAGTMSFDAAVRAMRADNIRCLLYTSPSFEPGTKERWRVLVPLSKNHPPDKHAGMVARVNGLLGGVFTPECFTLSQAYLFGRVAGNVHRVEVLDGDFIDQREDTVAGQIGKGGSTGPRAERSSSGPDPRDPEPVEYWRVEAALAVISSDCSYAVWLSVAGALYRSFGDNGFALFDRWSAKATGMAEDGTPRYSAEKAMERWRGARTLKQFTARTIFWLADQADRRWRSPSWDFTRLAQMRMGTNGTGAGSNGAGAGAGGGQASANAGDDEPQQAGGAPPPNGIPLEFYENFDKATPKRAIIKGVLYRNERSSWVGPPGSGKSALLASVAIHAAAGMDWRGHRSKEKVGVVYFALERGALVKRRMMAHRKGPILFEIKDGALVQRPPPAGLPPDLPIAVAAKAISLLSPACVTIMVETIRAAEAHFGLAVGLIVIDTFNKGIAMGGGDENAAKDQNITAANLQQVQEQTGVHIALIGHTGKDEKRGARGSNAHLGDVDMMVQISVVESVRTAAIVKINDGMEGVLTRFRVVPVTLGNDEDGDAITTAIVSDEVPKGRMGLNKTQQHALQLLEQALRDEGGPAPSNGKFPTGARVVPVQLWRDHCRRGGLSAAEAVKNADRTFSRAMKDLITLRRIGVWDGKVWVTEH